MPNSRSTLNTTAVWHISSTRSCATKSAARNCMRMIANAAVTYVLPSHNMPPPLPQCLYSQYYEALEPLPPLPQPPLWRSPPTSPTKPGGSSTRKKTEVEAHKQAISRHRAQWQRGPTPPGYWDIGFPDTQRVAALNAEADRMHARKRALVEEEAEYVVPFAHQLSKVRRLTRFTGGVEGIRSGSRNGFPLLDISLGIIILRGLLVSGYMLYASCYRYAMILDGPSAHVSSSTLPTTYINGCTCTQQRSEAERTILAPAIDLSANESRRRTAFAPDPVRRNHAVPHRGAWDRVEQSPGRQLAQHAQRMVVASESRS